VNTIARMLRSASITTLRLYNRLSVSIAEPIPDRPVLFVANHGFGGIVDLNVFAFAAAYDEMGIDRSLITLTHQIAWTLHAERLIEPFGARPANKDTALKAFAEGSNVLVFPGGDVDALKAWSNRNDIVFSGRTGFARLALEAQVPVVPVVTAGAGESLLVIAGGKRLAKATRVDKLLRLKALPLSVSIPWGVNLGLVGLLPYFPLPTKLDTSVLAPMTARPDESAEDFADRVVTVMQAELDRLTSGRKPVIG